MGISDQAVRNALSRGQEGTTIPPGSFKIGARRVWLRRDVIRWLNRHARATGR